MISQDVFDEMVQENMEDFQLSQKEALRETVQQLQKMGKDLSQVDTSGGEGREELIEQVERLRNFSGGDRDLFEILAQLSILCVDKHPMAVRNQNLMRTSGGISALIDAVKAESGTPLLLMGIFNLLTILTKTNVENRDFFEPCGNENLLSLIKSQFFGDLADPLLIDTLTACVKLMRVLAKSEINKTKFADSGANKLYHRALALGNNGHNLSELVMEVCLLLKRLCTHDDLRNEMSCAYENGRRMLTEGFIPPLMILACNFKNDTNVAVAALSAVRQIVVSEEAVKAVAANGAMDLPSAVYKWKDSPLSLIRSVTGLMRNLCADDDRKIQLARDGTLKLLAECLTFGNFRQDAQFVEHAFACCAAITLRSPQNSALVVEFGLIDCIVSEMNRHKDNTGLMRQGCLCFRNIAGRCPHLRSHLLDAGVEGVLRKAGTMQGAVDEAYASLRDLNLEVQYVKVDPDSGAASSVFESFGASKPQFNPVFDETCDLEKRVRDESSAPFKVPRDV